MNGSQILFADKCSIFFFFFPQMECVANVEKLGHCTYGSEFSDLLKNYWIWHHWPLISWSHQLAVQDGLPPDPRVCSSAPCGTTCPYCVSLPPMLLHPTFHLWLCEAFSGTLEARGTVQVPRNRYIQHSSYPGGARKPSIYQWTTALPAKCRTKEGINMVQHRDSAREAGWRSSEGHWAGFWRVNMSDSGRWLVGNTATVRMEWRTFIRSSVHLLPVAQGNLSSQQLPFPCPVSGGRLPWLMLVCLQPSAQALLYLPSVKTSEKFHLYQEEPAWLIPIYLQLLQLRQHSHSGKTGYLRVILLFELFVLEPLTFED